MKIKQERADPERRLKQKERFLLKRMGEAINDYNMISPGDRVCVAVSGGQDSLTTLKMLSNRTMMSALKYSIMAVHIKTDFSCANCVHLGSLKETFEKWHVEHVFGKADVVKKSKDRPVNCFWCSWNKRKEIFTIAEQNGANKIAFGHHKDDIIETTLLNLFFNGEVSTMNPKQEMFKGKLTIIRPLAYIEKKDITSFAKGAGLPVQVCACPYTDVSRRRQVRKIIEELCHSSRVIKSNIFRAPSRVKEEYLGKIEVQGTGSRGQGTD